MFIVNFIEIFVYWRNGCTTIAVKLATALAESVTQDTFIFAYAQFVIVTPKMRL